MASRLSSSPSSRSPRSSRRWIPGIAPLVHPRPWLGLAFFGFSLFAGLNVALPLVGVPPAAAVVLSAALAALGLMPTFFRARGPLVGSPPGGRARSPCSPSGRRGSRGRPCRRRRSAWSAPRWRARWPISTPIDPVARVTAGELREWGGLVAFTPVAAPAALRQPIEHRWRHEGRVVSTVHLPTPVQGGRAGRVPHLLAQDGLPARRPRPLDGGRRDRLRAADRPPALPGGRLTVLVDTHAHLHDPAFDADRPTVIARARAAGVAGFLTIGTDVGDLRGGGGARADGARRLRRGRDSPARRRHADEAALERIARARARAARGGDR